MNQIHTDQNEFKTFEDFFKNENEVKNNLKIDLRELKKFIPNLDYSNKSQIEINVKDIDDIKKIRNEIDFLKNRNSELFYYLIVILKYFDYLTIEMEVREQKAWLNNFLVTLGDKKFYFGIHDIVRYFLSQKLKECGMDIGLSYSEVIDKMNRFYRNNLDKTDFKNIANFVNWFKFFEKIEDLDFDDSRFDIENWTDNIITKLKEINKKIEELREISKKIEINPL